MEKRFGYCDDCKNSGESCSLCYRGSHYVRDNREDEH